MNESTKKLTNILWNIVLLASEGDKCNLSCKKCPISIVLCQPSCAASFVWPVNNQIINLLGSSLLLYEEEKCLSSKNSKRGQNKKNNGENTQERIFWIRLAGVVEHDTKVGEMSAVTDRSMVITNRGWILASFTRPRETGNIPEYAGSVFI